MFRLRERPGDATVLVGARNDEKANNLAEVQESSWVTAPQNRTERDARNQTARKPDRNPPEWFTFLGGTSQRHRGALKISSTNNGHARLARVARHNGIEAP